ncbi:MAG: DUF1330 domain-containing protein [Gammaproteobacteria bacterium]|nr:DUF1330 domain-containing protein [Gammaproteobacteria bacterium]
MPAYIVSVCDITSVTPELKIYAQKSAELARRHGGRYIIRGKAAEVLEGSQLAGKSVVILEFADMASLVGYVKGEEYQTTVKPLRKGTGLYDIGIFEGAPPPLQ